MESLLGVWHLSEVTPLSLIWELLNRSLEHSPHADIGTSCLGASTSQLQTFPTPCQGAGALLHGRGDDTRAWRGVP